ncbi:hypothetical protein NDU88_002620 [Pleurodeles waltl]|uniref:Uncharacterized protein n=1 Tax=Pleurodeles waltl TaxID=8319 RepID=A0AAV7MS81_PLEWA|nr:hypothetical protein NDU88_002620 [Pleurodeles waltl]
MTWDVHDAATRSEVASAVHQIGQYSVTLVHTSAKQFRTQRGCKDGTLWSRGKLRMASWYNCVKLLYRRKAGLLTLGEDLQLDYEEGSLGEGKVADDDAVMVEEHSWWQSKACSPSRDR